MGLGLIHATGDVSAERPAPVQPHRHYTMTASGQKVYVGPNFCDNEKAAQGLAGFHHEVHVKDPGLNNIQSEGCGVSE